MNQNTILSIICLALISQGAQAANKTAARATATTSSTQTTVTTPGSGNVSLSVGFGMPIFPQNGETAIGTNFGALARIEDNSRLLIGADLGLHFWGNSRSATENTTGLQLLPTVVYELTANRTLVPYVGLSAGPYLFFTPNTLVEFTLLFRPGLSWNATKNLSLNVEAKFGQIGSVFTLLPVTSLAIQL